MNGSIWDLFGLIKSLLFSVSRDLSIVFGFKLVVILYVLNS